MYYRFRSNYSGLEGNGHKIPQRVTNNETTRQRETKRKFIALTNPSLDYAPLPPHQPPFSLLKER